MNKLIIVLLFASSIASAKVYVPPTIISCPTFGTYAMEIKLPSTPTGWTSNTGGASITEIVPMIMGANALHCMYKAAPSVGGGVLVKAYPAASTKCTVITTNPVGFSCLP